MMLSKFMGGVEDLSCAHIGHVRQMPSLAFLVSLQYRDLKENACLNLVCFPFALVLQVAFVGWRGGYGKVVLVDHGFGYSTLYAHCNQFCVKKGQRIRKRQRIALSGNTGRSTGPHLHFEVLKDGKPIDPLLMLPQFRIDESYMISNG